MRDRLNAMTHSVRGFARRGGHRDEHRMPRRLRPRTARSTFIPLRDESVMRGLVISERLVLG